MNTLKVQSNFGRPGQRERQAYSAGDSFYEMLVDGHRGLSDAQSELMSARLVLLLANHVGDREVLAEAIALARANTLREPG